MINKNNNIKYYNKMNFLKLLSIIYRELKKLFLSVFSFLNEIILLIHKYIIIFQIWILTILTPTNYLKYTKLLSIPNIYIYTIHNYLFTFIFYYTNKKNIEYSSDLNIHILRPDKRTFIIWSFIYTLLLIYVSLNNPFILNPNSLSKYYKLELINYNLNTNRNLIKCFSKITPNFNSSSHNLKILKNNLMNDLIPSQKYIFFKKILKLYLAWCHIIDIQNDIVKRLPTNSHEQPNLIILQFLNNYDDGKNNEINHGLTNLLNSFSPDLDNIQLCVFLWALNGIYNNFSNMYQDDQSEYLEPIKFNILNAYDKVKIQLNLPEEQYQLGKMKFNQFLYLVFKEILLSLNYEPDIII